jgi:hypothetical protein
LFGTTTNAGYLVDVAGTLRTTGNTVLSSGGGFVNINNFSGTAVGAIRMKVDGSGYGLIVQPGSGSALTQYNAGNIVLPDGSGNNSIIEAVGTSGTFRFTSPLYQFRSGSNTAIYISGTPNVMVGSTTDNGNKFQVTGTARFDINGTNNRITMYQYSGGEVQIEFVQGGVVTTALTSGGRFNFGSSVNAEFSISCQPIYAR